MLSPLFGECDEINLNFNFGSFGAGILDYNHFSHIKYSAKWDNGPTTRDYNWSHNLPYGLSCWAARTLVMVYI